MSILVDALSRASVPVEFLVLFVGTSVSAIVLFVSLLVAANREQRERGKRDRRHGYLPVQSLEGRTPLF